MSCGCQLNPEDTLKTLDELRNPATEEDYTDLESVSVSGLKNKNVFDILKFAWNVDSEKVSEYFGKYGVRISSSSDLPVLAELSNTSQDVSGEVTSDDGKPMKFSVKDILSKIRLKDENIKHALKNSVIPFKP